MKRGPVSVFGRNGMKKLIFLFALPILLLPAGCEAPAKPPHIVFNSIGLKKIALKESGIKSYTQFAVFPTGVDPEHMKKYTEYRKNVEKKMYKLFGREVGAGWYCEVRFIGKDYYLFNSHESPSTVDVIGKQDRRTVLKLELSFPEPSFPVYTFAAREIVMHGKPYLVVYVDSRPRYGRLNKSALYLVDANFKVVYTEILTRAEEIGRTSDKRYGNCIVLRSVNHWRKFPDDERQPINGDWVYYLP